MGGQLFMGLGCTLHGARRALFMGHQVFMGLPPFLSWAGVLVFMTGTGLSPLFMSSWLELVFLASWLEHSETIVLVFMA